MAWNHRALHRGGTWGPGWAIAGWFLPPIIYVIPTLMLHELWKASDPDVPVGGDWRSPEGVAPCRSCGCVLYTAGPLISLASRAAACSISFAGRRRRSPRRSRAVRRSTSSCVALTVASAIAFVMLVRQLTDRHTRLTGEATR